MRLHRTNDGLSPQQILDFQLEIFRATCYDCNLNLQKKLKNLFHLFKFFYFADYIRKPNIGIPAINVRRLRLSVMGECNWIVHQLVVDDLDTNLCNLLHFLRPQIDIAKF